MIEFAPEKYWIELDWYDAKVYCFSLTIDGKTGWRLPTLKSLLIGLPSQSMQVFENLRCWISPPRLISVGLPPKIENIQIQLKCTVIKVLSIARKARNTED